MSLNKDHLTYKQVIPELIKYQDKIAPEMDRLEQEGKMPEELKKRWDAVKGGDDSTETYSELSHYLFEYQEMFDEKTRSHITEYRELIDGLFQLDEGIEND